MNMKKTRFVFIALALMLSTCLYAQKAQMHYVEASDLTLVGKLFPDTPNPYHRVDTVRYKGFTEYENFQVRMSSGISVAFRTNSSKITVKADYGRITMPRSSNRFTSRGFDLYVRKDGEWIWAGSNAPADDEEALKKSITIVKDMDGEWKDCLLYLPNFSELNSVRIGVDAESSIEAMENPFKGRVAMFGSSLTHGSATTRPGMAWPAQLSRMTGYQILSLGCGGNCKMQPYFAEALAGADADAFIFDTFSNPNAGLIRERLFPFIETIRAAHPDTPFIFINTLYREGRNFDTKVDAREKAKAAMADSLMQEAVRRYEHVYWIAHASASAADHETSVDGSHPSDYGYQLMALSVKDRLTEILDSYVHEEDAFPSKWLFSKRYIPKFEESWKNDHKLVATEAGTGYITAFAADGKPLERYDIVEKRPVAGPFAAGAYMLFEFPVKNLEAGSCITFDAVLTAEQGAPKDWQVEWQDGDGWKQGKTFRIHGPAFGKTHKYTTVYQTFRLAEGIADGFVRVRVRALDGDVINHPGGGEATAGLMLITQGYVGAYAQNFGTSVPKDTLKVLCIGNSFTYFSSCPSLLKELAWHEGHYIDIYAGVKGGRSMADHRTLEMTDDLAAQGGYDYVLLNDQSMIAGKVGADRKTNAGLVKDMVAVAEKVRKNSPECKVVVERTWAYSNKDFGGFGSYEAFDGNSQKGAKIMSRAIPDSRVSPIAEAFAIVRSERPDVKIYHTDNHHQSLYGAYLKSCVNYLLIYDEPFGNTPADCMLPAETAAYLRSVAERVVLK